MLSLNQVAGVSVRIWTAAYIIAFTIILCLSTYVIQLEAKRVKAMSQTVGRPRSGVANSRRKATTRGKVMESIKGVMTFKMQIHVLLASSSFFRIVWFACEGFIGERACVRARAFVRILLDELNVVELARCKLFSCKRTHDVCQTTLRASACGRRGLRSSVGSRPTACGACPLALCNMMHGQRVWRRVTRG
jgi:hypothetical protein